MRELSDSVEIELLRKEIRKHEIDLARAEKRSNVSEEELISLHEKIRAKKFLVETVIWQEQELETQKHVVRKKLLEIERLQKEIRDTKEAKTA